jgi:hypothetical protein
LIDEEMEDGVRVENQDGEARKRRGHEGAWGGAWGTLGDLIVKWGVWSGERPSLSAQARHFRWTTKQRCNTAQRINNINQTTWKQMVLDFVFIHFHSESIFLLIYIQKAFPSEKHRKNLDLLLKAS